LITVGEATGIAPARMVIPTIMSVALAFVLPSASARMTLVAVTGAVERKNMVWAGLVVGLPCAFVVIIFFYLMTQLRLI
jgi:sodium-dependent dicarboxylate transporter 2/3/5